MKRDEWIAEAAAIIAASGDWPADFVATRLFDELAVTFRHSARMSDAQIGVNHLGVRLANTFAGAVPGFTHHGRGILVATERVSQLDEFVREDSASLREQAANVVTGCVDSQQRVGPLG